MNKLSKTTVHIMARSGENVIGQGAGSLFRHGERMWLVTAGHVITNRHADTLEPLSHAWPDNVVAFVLHQEAGGLRWRPASFGLYDNDGAAIWIRHPDGLEVDIAAIEVTDSTLPADHLVVNDPLPEYVDFSVEAADDAFILGYPRGLTGGGHLPIWKAGSIASELRPAQPYILIDAASREGMSGGPVLARRVGIINPEGVAGLSDETVIGQAYRYLGVYASRIVHDDDGVLAQIGRVFLWREVERMIDNELYWRPPADA